MIDTLKISRRLESANSSEKQAEDLADILLEAVVTKDHLDARLAQTDAGIAQMDARMAQMEARLMRWMIGLTLAGVGISVALSRAASVIS